MVSHSRNQQDGESDYGLTRLNIVNNRNNIDNVAKERACLQMARNKNETCLLM